MKSNKSRSLYAFLCLCLLAGLYAVYTWLNNSSSQKQPTLVLSRILVSAEVALAIKLGKPVVALESTVITHGGLGFPRNLETGQALESQIRNQGAVPATIAIIGGYIRVGLNQDQLEFLAKSTSAVKCSKRDLGAAVALGWTGSTTVAATMFAAHAAGIQVFATGGMGGVHRGAFGGELPTLDVSADLTELTQTPVTVVCAGVKSILDVDGTLEWLETQGVPVASFDSTAFPQFFTQSTDLKSPLNLKSTREVASVIKVHSELQMKSGMVVAVPNKNPVPGIERIVEVAVKEAKDAVRGKDVTPFVLRRVAELSNGQSIKSNIELLMNNARVAGEIATELAILKGYKK